MRCILFHFCKSKFVLRVDHHMELIRGPNKETILLLSSLRPVECSHGTVKRKICNNYRKVNNVRYIFIIPEMHGGKKPHNMSCSVYPLILFASVCFWYVPSNWSTGKPLSHSDLFSIRLSVFILSPFENPFFSRTGHNVNIQTVCILRLFVCVRCQNGEGIECAWKYWIPDWIGLV